jgi:hypothetical protein
MAFMVRDQDAAKLLSELGVLAAFDGNRISRMLVTLQSKATADQIWNSAYEMGELQMFYLNARATVQLESAVSANIQKPRISGLGPDESTIEFEVVDVGAPGFDIQRIEKILPLIDGLYQEVCQAYELPQDPPRILYMDSGSGLIICLKGAAKPIESLRKLIFQIWDKVRYQKLEDLSKNLEAVDASLDVLDKIRKREASGSLPPEEAARLKHLIAANAIELFGTGTSLRELQRAEVVENRKLLEDKVSVKLLTAPSTSGKDDSSPPARI